MMIIFRSQDDAICRIVGHMDLGPRAPGKFLTYVGQWVTTLHNYVDSVEQTL